MLRIRDLRRRLDVKDYSLTVPDGYEAVVTLEGPAKVWASTFVAEQTDEEDKKLRLFRKQIFARQLHGFHVLIRDLAREQHKEIRSPVFEIDGADAMLVELQEKVDAVLAERVPGNSNGTSG